MNFTVIPAYNEESTIKTVVQGVQKLCSNVVVVDDGSDDSTYTAARAAAAITLRHFVNRGQGAALATGILYALSKGADIIVTFDADGQHDPNDILQLIEPILRGEADVVLGSRFLNSKCNIQNVNLQFKSQNFRPENQTVFEIPLIRFFILKLALLHQWFFTGLRVTDTHCGLRAFSRRAAEKMVITQDRMAHASEILDEIARHRLSFREVPVSVRYTPYSLEKGQRGFTGSIKILYDFFIGRLLPRER